MNETLDPLVEVDDTLDELLSLPLVTSPPPIAVSKEVLAEQTLALLQVWTANDPTEADETRLQFARDIVVRVHELAAEYAARSFAAARR